MPAQLWCVVQAHRKLLGTQESPHHGKIGELQQEHADVRARDRQREPNECGEGRLHGGGGGGGLGGSGLGGSGLGGGAGDGKAMAGGSPRDTARTS